MIKKGHDLIFFPAKAEILYFSNLKKGGHKGGQGRPYFTLNDSVHLKMTNFIIFEPYCVIQSTPTTAKLLKCVIKEKITSQSVTSL